MPRWHDDGVRVNLAVSTAGDFVSLGTRTEYPFVAGGTFGIPLGWNPNFSPQFNPPNSYLNITVANGRFSISNPSTTTAYPGNFFGAYRDFPVTAGKRYVFWMQTRTMENKAGVTWSMNYSFNGSGNAYGMRGNSAQDWEQTAQYMLTPAGTTFIRVFFSGVYVVPPGETTRYDWGAQWQLPAMVEYDSSYTEPVWNDVTCDVQSLSVAYGRSKYTGRFDVATANIGVTNLSGDFTYQTVHPWGLRPGRFVKVTITAPNGTTYPAYYGLIDSISDSFPIDGKVTALLNCIDTSSLLSNSTVPTAQDYATTSLSGLRFRHILDTVAWNPAKAVYDNGAYYQQAVLASGRTIRDELGIIADSEGGYFWTDREGVLTYENRFYISQTVRANTVYGELLAECPTWIPPMTFVFPGAQDNGLTIPYDSTLAFPNTVNIEALMTFDNIARLSEIAAQDSVWAFRKTATKTLLFNNGVSYVESSLPLPFNSGDKFYVKVVYDRAALTVKFSYAAVGAPVYTQLGTTQTLSTAMPSTTNRAIRIGGNGSTFVYPHSGRIDLVRIRNSTTIVCDFNANMWPTQAGATTLIIPNGQTITVSQTGTNKLLQVDTTTESTKLIDVDTVPTDSNAAIVHLKSLETDWSRDRVINEVQIANAGGAATQAVDFASQTKYGPRTYQRLDFINDNAHPEYNIERTNDFLNGWTESVLRVNSVSFAPNDDTYAWTLQMWLLDMVRVRYQHPTEGWGFAIATHIQGYVHNLTMGGWETTLNLDQPESFVYWDTPPDSATGWDAGYWDSAIWDNDDPNAAYWTSGQVWSDSASKWSI